MAMKCSARLVELRAIQQVVNKMIEINNAAARAEDILSNSGATAQLLLNAAGPYGTSNSLSDKADDLIRALDWSWVAES